MMKKALFLIFALLLTLANFSKSYGCSAYCEIVEKAPVPPAVPTNPPQMVHEMLCSTIDPEITGANQRLRCLGEDVNPVQASSQISGYVYDLGEGECPARCTGSCEGFHIRSQSLIRRAGQITGCRP